MIITWCLRPPDVDYTSVHFAVYMIAFNMDLRCTWDYYTEGMEVKHLSRLLA